MVLIKYSGKYVKIYFNMKITYLHNMCAYICAHIFITAQYIIYNCIQYSIYTFVFTYIPYMLEYYPIPCKE